MRRIVSVVLAAVGLCVVLSAPASAQTCDNCRRAPIDPAFTIDSNSRASVYRLYCAYSLRYPDHAGFNYWADTFGSGAISLQEISNVFSVSTEFDLTYGTLSNKEFMDLIYRNVLERPAGNDGYVYWLGLLNSGAVSRGYLMLFFSDPIEFKLKTGTAALVKPDELRYNADGSNYYANGTAVREAGAAPIFRGELGCGTHLDRDGDGIACEN